MAFVLSIGFQNATPLKANTDKYQELKRKKGQWAKVYRYSGNTAALLLGASASALTIGTGIFIANQFGGSPVETVFSYSRHLEPFTDVWNAIQSQDSELSGVFTPSGSFSYYNEWMVAKSVFNVVKKNLSLEHQDLCFKILDKIKKNLDVHDSPFGNRREESLYLLKNLDLIFQVRANNLPFAQKDQKVYDEFLSYYTPETAEKIDIMLNQIQSLSTHRDEKAKTYFLMGAPGLGKTFTSHFLRDHSNLPFIELKAGEFRGDNDRLIESSIAKKIVLQKNCNGEGSRNGIILMDDADRFYDSNKKIFDKLIHHEPLEVVTGFENSKNFRVITVDISRYTLIVTGNNTVSEILNNHDVTPVFYQKIIGNPPSQKLRSALLCCHPGNLTTLQSFPI